MLLLIPPYSAQIGVEEKWEHGNQWIRHLPFREGVIHKKCGFECVLSFLNILLLWKLPFLENLFLSVC